MVSVPVWCMAVMAGNADICRSNLPTTFGNCGHFRTYENCLPLSPETLVLNTPLSNRPVPLPVCPGNAIRPKSGVFDLRFEDDSQQIVHD